MILHWKQLPLHYGNKDQFEKHAPKFEKAHQTTYALLCCRFAPGDDRVVANATDHAERRLLQDPLWNQVHDAFERWTAHNDPIVTTMVINRSPCRDCAARLTGALHDLHNRFPVRAERGRFILACRGSYRASGSSYEKDTTVGDLRRLRDAGWELCVLQTGHEIGVQLSGRGQELLQALLSIGVPRGILRLEPEVWPGFHH